VSTDKSVVYKLEVQGRSFIYTVSKFKKGTSLNLKEHHTTFLKIWKIIVYFSAALTIS